MFSLVAFLNLVQTASFLSTVGVFVGVLGTSLLFGQSITGSDALQLLHPQDL